MPKFAVPPSEIQSQHSFIRPRIRLSLPLLMLILTIFCGWSVAPELRIGEFLILLLVAYISISSLVSICEITVIEKGLVINQLLLPKRFVPWDAIDRVVIFAHGDGQTGVHIEIASIGMYEGLSPLSRLPGLVYGQGLRQTVIITPDTLHDYDSLISQLDSHCLVIRSDST